MFALFGGSYPERADEFILTVDGKSWTLPAFQGQHGRGLLVEQAEPNAAIARANKLVVFQVGSWRRQLQAGPLLRVFGAACAQ